MMADTIRRAPAAEQPCACGLTPQGHRPRLLIVELHHLHQQSHQRKVYGRVIDHETIPLGGSEHAIVHHFQDRLRRGERVTPLRQHARLFAFAVEGLRRERAAKLLPA